MDAPSPTFSQTGLASYEAGLLINRAQRAFNELLATCLSHHGLTVTQWTLLGRLGAEPLRPLQVAKVLGLKSPTVTGLITQLTGQGLISVAPFADDERGKELQLTPGGRRLMAEVELKLQHCLNDQLGRLDRDQLTTYFEINRFIAEVRHI